MANENTFNIGKVDPSAVAPIPTTTAFDASTKKLDREKNTTGLDYAGAMYRQDGLADGAVRSIVNSQMLPDPGYNPFKDPEVVKLQETLWDEHKDRLYSATSATQALMIHDQLIQKQEDLTKLGDLGKLGNVGRFGLGIVNPESLLLGIASGGVANLSKAKTLASALKTAKTAAEATKIANKTAVAIGAAEAVSSNVAYEKVRQDLNYEHDNTALALNGLMGVAFSAPFVAAGIRSDSKLIKSLMAERESLDILKKAYRGQELSPTEALHIDNLGKHHQAISDLYNGKITSEEFHAATKDIQMTTEAKSQAVFDMNYGGAKQVATDIFDAPLAHSLGERYTSILARTAAKQVAPENVIKHINGLLPHTVESPNTSRVANVFSAQDTNHLNLPIVKDELNLNQHPMDVLQQKLFSSNEIAWLGDDLEMFRGKAIGVSKENPNMVVVEPKGEAKDLGQLGLFPDQIMGGNELVDGFIQRGSIGAGMIKPIEPPGGSGAVGQSAMKHLEVGGKKIQTRWDFYATFNNSDSKLVRELGNKLVKDPVMVNEGDYAQTMSITERKALLKRTISSKFHFETQKIFKEYVKDAEVSWLNQSSATTKFFEEVTNATRGLPVSDPKMEPFVNRAAAVQREVYKELLEKSKEANVKGVDEIKYDDFYANRVWRHDKIREAIDTHGIHNVERMIAESIKDKDVVVANMRRKYPDAALTDDDLLLKKAKSFLKAVRSLEFSPKLVDLPMTAFNDKSVRESLARELGLSSDDVDSFVDILMHERKDPVTHEDPGRMPNYKFRFGIDETAKVNTPNGTLRMVDLFENDSRVLVDTYGNTMSGHIAMAERGFHNKAEWDKHLVEISNDAMEKNLDGTRIKREIELLNDVYRNTVGQPMSTADFTLMSRAATAFRGYTRGAMLPQLGIAALFEMNNAAARVGYRAILKQCPTLFKFMKSMWDGHLPDEHLAKSIRLFAGFGQEKASSYVRMNEIEDGFYGQVLTKAEKYANVASHATDIASGNSRITSLTKHLTATASVQHLFEMASKIKTDGITGAKTLDETLMQKFKSNGIHKDSLVDVIEDLHTYATVENGVVKDIDYERWLRESSYNFQQFTTYVQRITREGIQDHDIGESMPWMHTTVGKIFAELKTFMLVAHAKNFLKTMNAGVNNKDYGFAAQVFTIGLVSEMMAYTLQTLINRPNDLEVSEEFLQKASLSAISRMSSLGFMSVLMNAGYGAVTGGDLFQEGSTYNTDSRSIWKTPSMIMAQRLANAPFTLTNMVNPWNDTVTTKKEFKDLIGSVPVLGNAYVLKGLFNYYANTLPGSDPITKNK